MHQRLVYIYMSNVPSFSSRYFNKIKRTSRLGRLLALSLEILNKCPRSDTQSPFRRFFAAFVYGVPSWQSVPRMKRIKTEFDEYLNSATKTYMWYALYMKNIDFLVPQNYQVIVHELLCSQ